MLIILFANCFTAFADSLSVLIDNLSEKRGDIYAGCYYDQIDGEYHIMSTDITALKNAITSSKVLAKAYSSFRDNIVFEKADFTLIQLQSANDRIVEVLEKSKALFSCCIFERKQTIEIQTDRATINTFREYIRSLADEKSAVSGASLSERIIFVEGAPSIAPADSATPQNAADIPALQLSQENVTEFYMLDAKNQAYIKRDFGESYSSEVFKSADELDAFIISAINGMNAPGSASLMEKKLPLREGNIVVFLEDGTRYSYYFEEDNVLNINGDCFTVWNELFKANSQVLHSQLQKNKIPKWLAWMKLENITAITGHTPKGGMKAVAKDMLKTHANLLYRHIFIESGEKYERDKINLPSGFDVFKADISFKSGTTHTLIMQGKTLYIESSDMSYGYKYKTDALTAKEMIQTFDRVIQAASEEELKLLYALQPY